MSHTFPPLSGAELEQTLGRIVGAERVHMDADSLQQYGLDRTRQYTPAPCAIVFPEQTTQVRELVLLARRHRLAIVPSGGRTGLSGGAVAAQGELVIALERMNRILDFNAVDRSLHCEAGMITAQLQAFAQQQNLFYPVDFASSGSSQIGGNVATNAGGIKVIRYGLTRDQILGLTVVTGQGDILQLNRGLVKNATGYDLRHLFIGSEGTLGLITEVTVRLMTPPENPTVMVLGITDMSALMQVLEQFRQRIEPTAFEFFSEPALQHVIRRGLARPFAQPAPFYALLEFESRHESIQAAALAVFEYCLARGWVLDGVMSQNGRQAAELWRLREDISETIAAYMPYKNDLSVRVSRVPEFLAAVDQVVAERYAGFEVIWYGHIGDGNLHLNILKPAQWTPEAFFRQCEQVNKDVFAIVRRLEGSISAEHGVGLLKRDYLDYSRSPEELACLRAIKQLFDPDHIMNPGKLLA
ncbi:MAG TPA: FAD-binding oxidoreductase [Thiolinea sp.]|nr:FAD-binding oxidoreductase [Thiolinea sp.]